MTLPLADIELERSYVAHVVVLGDAAHLSSVDRLSPLDCAFLEHGKLLAAAYDMHARGEAVDALTLHALLEAQGASRGTVAALLAAHDGRVRLEPPRHMADRLRALARARRVHERLMQGAAEAERMHVDDALERAREALGEEHTAEREEAMQAGDTCRAAMVEACEAATTKPRYRSGLARLDAAIRGFPRRTMAVIGGDTGSGKSSLMLAIAMDMVEKQGARVGIVSVEDAASIWGERVLAHVCDVNPEQLGEGRITGELRDEANRGIELADQLGLYFRFALSKPLPDVLEAMRDLVVTKRCDVLMVDYAQAIAMPGSDRRVAMIEVLRRLKGVAQELGVPFVLASQLSRGDSDFREPSKRALKEAGELADMAEVIVLLWHTSDREGAPVLGKVAKVKWSPRRPRFELLRNPRGAVCGLGDPPAAPTERPSNGFKYRQPPAGGHSYDD